MRSTGRNTDFSLTGKLGLTSNLTLDASYNPDFSQVETDAGQIDVNLRSFHLLFRRKRPFFLEGMENFNFATAMEQNTVGAIVYTRSIVDPLLGLKLTGKIGSRNVLSGIFALDEYPGDLAAEDGGQRTGRPQCRLLHPALQAAAEPGQLRRRLFHRPQLRRRAQPRRRHRRPLAAEQHQLCRVQLFQVVQPRPGRRCRSTRGTPWACATTSATGAGTSTLGFFDLSNDFRIDTGYVTRTGITMVPLFVQYCMYPKSKFFQRIDTFWWSYHLLDKHSDLFETYNHLVLRLNMPRQTPGPLRCHPGQRGLRRPAVQPQRLARPRLHAARSSSSTWRAATAARTASTMTRRRRSRARATPPTCSCFSSPSTS